jgi:hypothetical protein
MVRTSASAGGVSFVENVAAVCACGERGWYFDVGISVRVSRWPSTNLSDSVNRNSGVERFAVAFTMRKL